MSAPLLSILGLESGYGEYTVLRDISINVGKSELVSIIGPNGAGKSTLLKTIIGLVKAKKGEIKFLDEVITNRSPGRIAKVGIGYVPQGSGLFPQMSVRENIEAGAYLLSDKSLVDQRTKRVLEMFPRLKERFQYKAYSLSGGERQMVLLGRALMLDPELILLDEPSVGLDPKMQLTLYNTIKELKESGKTILLVEQNVRKALELADRCYVMEVGKIVYEGTGQEMISTERVRAAYLGV